MILTRNADRAIGEDKGISHGEAPDGDGVLETGWDGNLIRSGETRANHDTDSFVDDRSCHAPVLLPTPDIPEISGVCPEDKHPHSHSVHRIPVSQITKASE